VVERATAFRTSRYGRFDDCHWGRRRCPLENSSEILVAFAAIGAWFIGTEAAQSVDGMSPGGFILGASLGPVMLLACFLSFLGRLKAEWRDIACRAVAISIAAIGMMTWTFELWRAHSPMPLR
jgi:hypothetical protein